jgi:hypothetical protein
VIILSRSMRPLSAMAIERRQPPARHRDVIGIRRGEPASSWLEMSIKAYISVTP